LLQILKFVEDKNHVNWLDLCQPCDDPKINSNDDDNEHYKNKVDDEQLTRRIGAKIGAERSWG
jgi:hypothetical protein